MAQAFKPEHSGRRGNGCGERGGLQRSAESGPEHSGERDSGGVASAAGITSSPPRAGLPLTCDISAAAATTTYLLTHSLTHSFTWSTQRSHEMPGGILSTTWFRLGLGLELGLGLAI